MFIQLAFTSKWNKAALLLRCIWLFFEVSCLLFTYFLKILQVNRFGLIRLLYGVAVTRNIFWDSRSVSGNTYPETCFIVDYANKSNPEWISITPILFVCLRPSEFSEPFPQLWKLVLFVHRSSVISLSPPNTQAAWSLHYLFFLSLIRDSIKKVNEVCRVLVFTIFYSPTKFVVATCLGLVNVHWFIKTHLSEN